MFISLLIWTVFLESAYSDFCSDNAIAARQPYCCNGLIHTERISSSSSNYGCNYKTEVKIDRLNCSKKNDEPGICQKEKDGKFYCLAEDTVYTAHVDDNCKCIYKATKKLRTCCCPDQTIIITCDKNTEMETTINTTYQLINDQDGYTCKAIVNQVHRYIVIPNRFSKQIGICTKEGIQTIVIKKKVLDGCKIIEVIDRTETRVCGCFPKQMTENTCITNTDITTRIYENVNVCCECSCICVKQLKSIQKRTVRCPKSEIIKGQCINNRYLIVTITYKRHNCRCIEEKNEHTESCGCSYKELSKKVDPCCECRETELVTITYQDKDCQIKTREYDQECTCNDPPPFSTRTFCDHGDWNTVITTNTFDKVLRKCITKSTNSLRREKCIPKSVKVGRCGEERKYYEKETTFEHNIDINTCKCKRKVSTVFIICDHPPKVETDWKCEYNDKLVKRITNYFINKDKNNYSSKTNVQSKTVKCPKAPPIKIVSINEYYYDKYKYFSRVKNCQCVIKSVVKRFRKRCDDPSIPETRCEHNDKQITTQIFYKLNFDRTKCIAISISSNRKIICIKYLKTSRSRCINGRYFIYKQHYGVKNCKCVKLQKETIPIVIVCNPRVPIVNTKCEGKRLIIKTTTSGINDCKCVKRSKYVIKEIGCLLDRITYGKCDHTTGNQFGQIYTHEIVNCKCVPKRIPIKKRCICKLEDRLKRTRCVGNKRIVLKLRYKNVGDKCAWEVIESESEDCKCCPTKIKHGCRNNLKFTTKIYHHLVWKSLKLLVERCVLRTCTTYKAVVCNKGYTEITQCKNYQQRVITCTYEIRNCECVKVCNVDCIRACNCPQKNKCVTKCLSNKLHQICHYYTGHGERCGCGCHEIVSKCVKNVHTKIIPTSCFQPQPRITCSKCIYEHNHGFYKKCIINKRVKINCRCHLKSTPKTILCRCKPSFTRSICRNNNRVVITTDYVRYYQSCVERNSEFEIGISCQKSYIITNNLVGHIEYILVYFVKENCRCVEKRLRKVNYECKRGERYATSCVNNKRIITQHQWIQRNSNKKLFNQEFDSPWQTFCEDVTSTRTENIFCPYKSRVQWCNTKTNILHIILTFDITRNCQCIRQNKHERRPCKICTPRLVETRGPCDNSNLDSIGFLDLTTKTSKVTTRNTCKTYIRHSKEVCRCPRPRERTFCQNGKSIYQRSVFLLRTSPPCKMRLYEKIEPIHCYNHGKPNRWNAGIIKHCQSHGQYTIQTFNREEYRDCRCTRRSKKVKVGICCKGCRIERKCIANRHVTIFIHEYARGLKCVVKHKSISRPVYCPPLKKILIGGPIKCVQKFVIKSYISKNCRCFLKNDPGTELVCCDPESTTSRHCFGNGWEITITNFILEHKKCKPYPVVTYDYLCTCPLYEVTTEDKKLDECSFMRSYFKNKIVECKYVSYLSQTRKLFNCCPYIKNVPSCKNNRVKVTTTHYELLSNFRCVPRVRRSENDIDCSHLVLRERVPTGPCQAKDIFYRIVYKDCSCHREIVRVDNKVELSCDCRKPYSTVKCNERNGLKTLTDYTYHLRHERCILVAKHTYSPTNCDNKNCNVVVGPCQNNNNLVKMFCLRRNRCKCVRKLVKQNNQCCKPESHEWKVTGECIESNCIRKIRYYAFRMNKDRSLCIPIVIKVQKRLCCCQKPISHKHCVDDTRWQINNISFYLNEDRDTCFKCSKVSSITINGCYKRKRKVRVVSQYCNLYTGWSTIITEYVHAKNCLCVKTRKTTRCPCVCKVAFPTQEKTYCKQNRLITETKIAVCHKCRVRWTVKYKHIEFCHCNRIVTERGNCFPARDGYAVSIHYISKIQYQSKDCKCFRKELRRWKEHCECRKQNTVKKCLVSKIRVTNNWYILSKGLCKKISKRHFINIPCPSQPQVTSTKCINNQYNIVTRKYYYDQCRCLDNTCIRKCDCSCPAKTVTSRCTGQYFIEITTVWYTIKNCRCVRNERRRRHTPICPKYVKKSIGPCVNKGNTGHKKIIQRHLQRRPDICKCLIVQKIHHECCWCKANKKTIHFCRNNDMLITQTSKRVQCTGSTCCKRVVIMSSTVRLQGNTEKKYHCNVHTHRDVITTITHYIVNCVRKVRIDLSPGFCICPKDRKRIAKGKCLRSNRCIRKDTYIRKELKDRRCVDVQEYENVICCCPKEIKTKECEKNAWNHLVIKHSLVRRKCIKKSYLTIEPVFCSTKLIVEKGYCNTRTGNKKIRQYRFFNRNCQCVKEKVNEFSCKCRCANPSVTYECDNVAKILTKAYTKYSICDCKCRPKVDFTKIAIICPVTKTTVSKCLRVTETDYWERIYTTTTYSVNYNCKCVPHVVYRKEICKCERNEKVTKTCDAENHVITTVTTFKIIRNHACVMMRYVIPRCVCCGSGKWVLKGDSGCIAAHQYGIQLLCYVRQVPVGCQCKEERKSKQCNCLCNGPSHRSYCDRTTNELVHIYYSYKLINCKCVVSKHEKRQRVKCSKLNAITKPCLPYRDGVYREYTTHRYVSVFNCKCRTMTTETWVACKCPDAFVVHSCDRARRAIVTTRTWYQLLPTMCRKQTQTTFKPVLCDSTVLCKLSKGCKTRHTGNQVHKCTTKVFSNCKCINEPFDQIRPCRCKPTHEKRGSCNTSTRHRKIWRIRYFLYVERDGKTVCRKNVIHRLELCSCPAMSKTTECQQNKLITTWISHQFNDKFKTCRTIVKKIDNTPQCCPKNDVRKKLPNGTLLIFVTEKSLVNCKCNVKEETLRSKWICLDKPNKTIECIHNSKLKFSLTQYTLTSGKCPPTTTVTYKTVHCPGKRSYYETPCSFIKRTRIKVTIWYKVNKCQCLKFMDKHPEICMCADLVSWEVCIPALGVFRKTITTEILDERRHICLVSKAISDRYPYCNTTPRKICERCKVTLRSTFYKKCTTTVGKKIGCTCVYRSQIGFELCQCPATRTSSKCVKNKTKLRIFKYYIRVPSPDKIHDYQCVLKSKIVNSKRICCPKVVVEKSTCVNLVTVYTKKYFVHVNCVCILKVKSYRVPCECPSPKVISNRCVHRFITVTLWRHEKLVCYSRGPIPQCQCIPWTIRNTQMKICRSYELITPCVGNTRRIKFVRYRVVNCKCVKFERTIVVHCGCRPEMRYCPTIKTLGQCSRPLYQLYYCHFSCGYCEPCPKKCVKKSIGQCKCQTVAGIRLCTRKIEVVINKIVNRRCAQIKSTHDTLCSCSLEYSKHKCENLKKQGRCRERRVMRKCQFVCHASCQSCKGRIVQRRCIQSGRHKAIYKYVVVSFNRICNICTATTNVTFRGACLVCAERRKLSVTDCVNNSRFVLTRYVLKQKRKCVNKASKVVFSCKNCCPTVETKIGDCINGKRTVLTIFWANIHNCCKKQTVSNVYSCNERCTTVSHASTKCINNKQMYVRVWKSGQRCRPHSVSELKSCIPS